MYLGTTPGATPYILGAQTDQGSVVFTGGPSRNQLDGQPSGKRWRGASPKASSIQVLHLPHLSAPWTSTVCCCRVSPLMLARPPMRHRLCASESNPFFQGVFYSRAFRALGAQGILFHSSLFPRTEQGWLDVAHSGRVSWCTGSHDSFQHFNTTIGTLTPLTGDFLLGSSSLFL